VAGRRVRHGLGATPVAVLVTALAALVPGHRAGAAVCAPGDTGVVDVSNTPRYAEGEEPLAVDPTNACRVIAAANVWQPVLPGPLAPAPIGDGMIDTAVYTSADGGRTWTGGRLDQGGLGAVADPAPASLGFSPEFNDLLNVNNSDADVAWDGHGYAYYESGDIHGIHHGGDEVATVWRSRDGGQTWGTGSTAVSAAAERNELDRPWFAIDRSGGRRDGNVYMTFETSPFVDDPPMVFVKRSADGGRTWAPSTRVDDGIYETQFNPRNRPTVGADGALSVVYDRASVLTTPFAPQAGPIALVLARSVDGGHTFTRTVIDAGVHRIASPDEALTGYTEMISAIASDPTRSGHLAVAWPEQVGKAARIMLRTSTDGGVHWSRRVDVADDPPRGVVDQHDHVALTFLPDGRVAVLWRDRRCCGGAYDSDFQQWARAFALDNGAAPSPSGPVVEFTAGPQPVTTGHHGTLVPDEFQGLSASPLGLMATWAQRVGQYTDVVFRRIPLDRFAAR